MTHGEFLHIGTCSWKYDSWRGLVYPEDRPINYLEEYSRWYRTVEVDQWFWSLFTGDRVILPKESVVREYAVSVPAGFTFGVKVPNAITLTHYYRRDKRAALVPNPHFLSSELMLRFLDSIEPVREFLGPLMFQFEYLNKQKMGSQQEFLTRFEHFVEKLPADFQYAVETRNPAYLDDTYFAFLSNHRLRHVFLQGYYMPSIFDLYKRCMKAIGTSTVIRLLGPDRRDIEKETGKNWDRIVAPRDQDLKNLSVMLTDLEKRRVNTWLFVNNHFEGSAPRTISRIETILGPLRLFGS